MSEDILKAQPSQFSLSDAGEVLFQPLLNNPVPGAPVAKLIKGENILQPKLELLTEVEGAEEFLGNWLKVHIVEVLEPLITLLDEQEGIEIKPYVKDIAAKVFQAMGILPREELQGLIAQLDADDRRVLRAKKIKLGPLLVFQPDLNKPAAVRLRALLYCLANDKPLPAPVPKDGVVSQKIEADDIDKDFYQAIGYPVLGGRAIRIDMLDRVISAVYDNADKGQFKAQHQMAEWLGCGIEDLYAVLIEMGHTKIHDPADEISSAVIPSEAESAVEESAEDKPEDKTEEKSQEKPQEKPELATFRLKRGKANEKGGDKKPFKKKPSSEKKPEKKKGKRNKSTHRAPKVMSAEAQANPEDNPFAALAQLKDKSNVG